MLEKSRERVFHYILETRAAATPDRAFLTSRERTLSFAEANRAINRLAAGFAAQGITKGDRVLVMMPSGIDYILTWQALSKIGALMVPVNDAFHGRMLENQIIDAEASLAVVGARFLSRWSELAHIAHFPRSIVVHGAREDAVGHLAFDDLPRGDGENPPPVVEYTDPTAILYTSGTTGPSKGVIYGFSHAYATALPLARLCVADDVFYMFLPMFHTGLPHIFGTALLSGATMAIREKFSTSEFWNDVRHFRATATLLIATMPAYLMTPRPAAGDRDNGLRLVFMTPMLKTVDEFKARFGCESVVTLYNMTEASTPLITGTTLVNTASCGRPRPGISARIVDENDEEVAHGETGELILRSNDPWEFNLGYWRKPAATAEAWRNQWLHTGDLLSRDEDGNFYFKDRLKDAIRRRGENISSFEVEFEVKAHPAIAECAAIAVPAALGEDEVKIVVTLFPGTVLDPRDLIGFLIPRMPAYMLPRYVQIRAELPRTPTGKIQKMRLREESLAEAWDREVEMPETVASPSRASIRAAG